ncbi:hypothetical protein [Chitinilyticum aquatile]|uniref:hypothetical protein n=1 Tax=Chitinilyticum aquatile TaxID=362520 RepID=UPI00049198BF|nr:hypothetical protein [Chitinilyticum aquatile]
MNPKLLETSELVLLDQQADEMLKKTAPQSVLYQLTDRLRLYLQLEMIRRGIFTRKMLRLRAALAGNGVAGGRKVLN